MPPAARLFSNRYAIEREVGRGGMAEVYVARDQLLDRLVAVKVLDRELAADPTFVERFRREAQAAANLTHPGIVAVYDWGEDGDTYFIVMEYVEGHTLRDLLRTHGRVPTMEAARIAAEIADALAFAHRNGVVHRDVKPGNILLTEAGQVKVTDFGIARAGNGEALTKTGAVMGTATYFSPEQAQGLALDGRADVYSLGVVLYEMVAGVPPFTGDNPVSVAYKHVRERPTPPSRVAPELPGAMDRIVLTALAKDVEQRYQSAADLRADLLRFERGRPLAGGPAANVTTIPTLAAAAPAVDRRGRAVPPMAARPTPAPNGVSAPGGRGRSAALAIATALGLLVALIVVLLLTANLGGGGSTVPQIGVDNVVGIPFAQAEAAVQKQGFKVVRLDVDSDQPAEQVLSQSPGAGRRLAKGGIVRLSVSSSTITMPNVVGRSREQALSTLQQHHLNVTVVQQDAANATPGTVLSTDPAAGAKVPKTAPNVTVTVAREPPVAIPDVSSQDPTAAANTLTQAGFQVTTVQTPSDTVPVGKVVGTDPAAGTMLSKGETVKLLVSSGPDLVDVPSTVGQTQADAIKTLQDAGFGVQVSFQSGSPAQRGRVIAQAPVGGKAKRGSTIAISVGL